TLTARWLGRGAPAAAAGTAALRQTVAPYFASLCRCLMRAAVLEGVEKMVVRKVVDPAPLPNEVLLRVKAVGVCGTDLHLFRGHGNYHLDSRGRPIPLEEQPQILGHEFSVEVVEAGPEPIRNILICGAGPAGLLFLEYLRNVKNFPGLILTSDVREKNLELARRFGGTPVNVAEKDLAEAVTELTHGERVHYLIEAA